MDGTQRSQDGGDRHRRRGAGDAGVHGACLPVMRASTCEETRRISFTSRSSSRLFSIHSRAESSFASASVVPSLGRLRGEQVSLPEMVDLSIVGRDGFT